MADNVAITAGSGVSIASDDIGGVQYQRVKIAQGADGVGVDVSSAAPLQVSLANTGANATPIVVDLGANNDVTVTGTVTANLAAGTNNIGDVDVLSLPAIPAGTNNIGDVDVLTINGVAPAFGSGVRGATVQRVTIATDDVVPASQSGTWNIGTVTTVSTLSNTTQLTPGTAATNLGKSRDSAVGATDTGVAILGVRRDTPTAETPAAGDYIVPQYSANGEAWVRTAGELADDAAFTVGTTRVQPVGYLADSTSTDSVDEGDIGAARMTLDRKQIMQPYADPVSIVSGAITTAMTGTTSTSLVAAPGAGLRNYLTTIIVSNAHGTVGTDVIIQDGSGGTTLMTIPAAAVYGGAVITLPTPLRQPTTATAIFCANVTTGASTKVSAVGYTAP